MNLDQMTDILASDQPTDWWVQYQDGHIEAHPNTGVTPHDAYPPNTWPIYICQSQTIDNLVAAMGPDGALNQINTMLNNLTRPTTLGGRLGQSITQHREETP